MVYLFCIIKDVSGFYNVEIDKKEVKNIHAGHRQRMKDKALKYGFDSFENHEILEMLLYSVIPQKDTNPLAHELINTFGSFHAVFEAPEKEFLNIKGMNKSAVFLLKSIPAISSFYMQDKVKTDNIYIKSSEDAYKFLSPKFIGKTVEVAMVVLLNNSGKLLACESISDGIVNAAEFSIRKVIELCVKHNATQVILAHNHPSGVALPSMDDFIATKNVNTALKAMNCKLLDHLIIVENDYTAMSLSSQFKNAFK